MEHSILIPESDLWIIINALSDKASHYRFFAENIRRTSTDDNALPGHRLLAEMFDRQANAAERIRGALAAYV